MTPEEKLLLVVQDLETIRQEVSVITKHLYNTQLEFDFEELNEYTEAPPKVNR